MGVIVAASAGTGKTSLARQCPDKILDLECVPYKYDMEPGTVYGEADKANFWDIAEDWPRNYITKIKEVQHSRDFILIPPDVMVLELLRSHGIPYILAYPDRKCKEEYRARFIERGNQEEFLHIFVDGWDRFMDTYEDTYSVGRVVLGAGEFLSLDRLRAVEASYPQPLLDLNSIYSVSRDELALDAERILAMSELGFSPILIKADNHPDLLLFSWADYTERFGALDAKIPQTDQTADQM